MMVRGECYPLPPWAQDTGATAFGELSDAGMIEAAEESAPWPTPTVFGNGNRSEYGGKSGDGLDTAVKRAAESAPWPTPTCAGLDGGSNSRKAAKRRGRYIEGAGAKSAPWPTPRSRDSHPESIKAGLSRHTPSLPTAARVSATWPTPQANDAKHGMGENHEGHQIMLIHAIRDRAAAPSATGPTPKAHDRHTTTEREKPRDNLNSAVERGKTKSHIYPNSASAWPTPTVNDSHGVSPGQTPRDILSHAVEKGETKSHTYPTVGTRNMGGCSGSFSKFKHLVEIGRQPPEDARGMAGGMKAEDGATIENCGMLNPDWVEWLMGWPIGWTDIDDGGELLWLELDDDPAEWEPPLMHRITRKKKHRVKRIETLGNGQVPLCAAVAFVWGFEILRVIVEGRKAA